MKISAYIPCYNNSTTIAAAIAAIRAQTHAIDELLVIDDGSTDGSVELLEQREVRLLRNPTNMGRGSVRAQAMNEVKNELVLCCDATNMLAPDFISQALPWFEDPKVAAVFGKITQPDSENVVDRWRGRHLFKLGHQHQVSHHRLLATYGAMVRRSSVMAVGNYEARLRYNEDGDLGQKLLDAGGDVVYDPRLVVTSVAKNSLIQVLERYWRWNSGTGRVDCHGYLRSILYSIKVMAKSDLIAGDFWSVPISLLSPHYQFLKTISSRLKCQKS